MNSPKTTNSVNDISNYEIIKMHKISNSDNSNSSYFNFNILIDMRPVENKNLNCRNLNRKNINLEIFSVFEKQFFVETW